jgi:hypothetical protein
MTTPKNLPETKVMLGTALHRLADVLGPQILYESERIIEILDSVRADAYVKGYENGKSNR